MSFLKHLTTNDIELIQDKLLKNDKWNVKYYLIFYCENGRIYIQTTLYEFEDEINGDSFKGINGIKKRIKILKKFKNKDLQIMSINNIV